jgi:hypothetical protein
MFTGRERRGLHQSSPAVIVAAMKLRDLYPKLSGEERKKLATAVGVSPGYLWQIATGWLDKEGRVKRASLDLVAKLAAADARLHVHDMVDEFKEQPSQEAA